MFNIHSLNIKNIPLFEVLSPLDPNLAINWIVNTAFNNLYVYGIC